MIRTSRLPLFMVVLLNTPRHSRERQRLHGVFGQKKTLQVGPALHYVTETLFWLVAQNF